MGPKEMAAELERFKKEIEGCDDEALLDAWIAHEDKADMVPDLDIHKSLLMEALLLQKYGMKYQSEIAARRERH